MSVNELLLAAIRAEQKGDFKTALEKYTETMNFYLYKMMYSIENVQKYQAGRQRCFNALRRL